MQQSGKRPKITDEAELLSLALALGAREVAGWTTVEQRLAESLPEDPLPVFVAGALEAINRREDPLGEQYCRVFSNEQRRPQGATYTPELIVKAMLDWAQDQVVPARVVDLGAGSARFLVAAGRRFPDAELVASELDPLATILARGHLAAAGLAERANVVLGDYRSLSLPPIAGPTLYLGNPPYVRHHLISSEWKAWLTKTARQYGYDASQLAGLHVHFFLATAEHAQPGDVGVLITAAE